MQHNSPHLHTYATGNQICGKFSPSHRKKEFNFPERKHSHTHTQQLLLLKLSADGGDQGGDSFLAGFFGTLSLMLLVVARRV